MHVLTFYSSRLRIIFTQLLVVTFFASLALSFTGWRELHPVVEESLGVIGLLLVGVGLLGRIWCATYICGSKQKCLVTEGPYSICRNPLYFFSFLAGLGVALITETLTYPLILMVFYWIYYPGVMAAEEETLRKLHGAAFEEYYQRVPRFWPRLRLYHEPSTYSVSAPIFRRFLGESIWFLVAAGGVHAFEELHTTGWLPVLWRVY